MHKEKHNGMSKLPWFYLGDLSVFTDRRLIRCFSPQIHIDRGTCRSVSHLVLVPFSQKRLLKGQFTGSFKLIEHLFDFFFSGITFFLCWQKENWLITSCHTGCRKSWVTLFTHDCLHKLECWGICVASFHYYTQDCCCSHFFFCQLRH